MEQVPHQRAYPATEGKVKNSNRVCQVTLHCPALALTVFPTLPSFHSKSLHNERLALLLHGAVIHPSLATGAAAGSCRLDSKDCTAQVGFAGSAHCTTLFDLASLTKPCIALTTSLLVGSGALSFQNRICELLPELASTPGGQATIEQHLSHRAGMRAHLELFRASWSGQCIDPSVLFRRAALSTREGSLHDPLYSDLGYVLVGRALEKLTRMDLDRLVDAWLCAPLDLEIASARNWARKDPAFRRRALATEVVPERGGEIRGIVHDDNAWVLSGTKTSGHAGLFGTLAGVLRLGALLAAAAAGQGPLAHAVGPLLKPRKGGSLRMGFDGVSGGGSMAGTNAETNTFGHLGFTGTSLWCDPQAGIATVLLTNRTYPCRTRNRIKPIRPIVHDVLREMVAAGGMRTS